MKTLDVAVREWREWQASPRRHSESVAWSDAWLSDVVGPVEPGTLIVVGGRPNSGKSMLALYMMASTPVDALYVSLEDSEHEVARRAVSMPGHRRSDVLLYCPTSKDPAAVAAGIERAAAERLVPGTPWLVAVDYAQLLRGATPSFSRTDELAGIIDRLQVLSKLHGFVLVLLAQINRPGSGGSRKADPDAPPPAPTMFDLAQSACLEQSAQVVLLVHPTSKVSCQVALAKHKSRVTGDIGHFTRTAQAGWLEPTQPGGSTEADPFA